MDKENRSALNDEFKTFPADLDLVRTYIQRNARQIEVKGHYGFRIFFLFLRFCASILTFNGAYRFGKFIGLIFYKFKLRRHIAITNMSIVWGDSKSDEEKELIYKESLINFGQVIVNWLRLPFKNDNFWKENVRFTNETTLQKAMNQKKGVILLAAHLGMWDLAGGKIGMSGYPVSVVARRIKNSFLDRWIIDTRCRMNFGSIQNKNSMDRILEGLNHGEAVAVAIDQSMQPAQGVFIDWMGRTASSVRSVSYMAKKSGAVIVSGYMLQHGPRDFELCVEEEIPYVSHPDPEEELLINTQKQSYAIQKIILKHPEKWFWIHRRWKVQPEGVPDPYRSLGSEPE
ncbi:MAG: hypothetical protein HOD92_14095 [Deltaproteobacteria bacterium]|jgi:Kdo2-lipid IVA lauroyltransferase/acyltransferase|nr:hypothetical protein [Deltaproteobacteria bacterium]